MRKNKQEIILLKNLLTKIFGFSRIIKEEKKDKSKKRRKPKDEINRKK